MEPFQIAERTVADAIFAIDRRHVAELRRCLTLLADGEGVASRALLTVAQSEAKRAWDRGWQPAELVRHASREQTAKHARLMADVIAAQMRVYAAATIDPRWQAQLTAVDAQVWWDHDDRFVDAHGADRLSTVTQLVELVYLLRTLPSIERIGPVPGAGVASDATLADADPQMLNRVRALLAKAESTDFPEEAEAFTAKAQQLMARHSIDQALLDARSGRRDHPATRRVPIDNPYETPKTLLLQVIAEANRCRAVWMKRYAVSTVVGFPSDLDSTELLFTSLLVQATKAMMQISPRQDRFGRNNTRSFRHSFLTAYATRIGERLNAATEEASRETDASDLLPVLSARHEAVQEAFTAQFPALTTHATKVSNREGWASGRAAADRAHLHGHAPVTR